jgi:hypothetical protein
LSENETNLLQKINKGAPSVFQKRYNYLKKKRNDESLTDKEYQELLDLTKYMETLQVERTANLIELAKLINISLDELIEQLEIKAGLNVE